jgi:hypothetical protein
MRPLALVLGLALLASSAAAGDLVHEFAVPPDRNLRIALDEGNIEVVTHDRERVRVEVSARGVGANAIRFRASEQGGRLLIESEPEPWLRWLRRGPSIHVRAFVPRGLQLELATAGSVVTRDAGVSQAFPAGSALAAH